MKKQRGKGERNDRATDLRSQEMRKGREDTRRDQITGDKAKKIERKRGRVTGRNEKEREEEEGKDEKEKG